MTERRFPGPAGRLRDAILRRALWVVHPLSLLPVLFLERKRVARLGEIARLVPVSLSTVFGESRSPRELRALGRRCLLGMEVLQIQNQRLVRGAGASSVSGLEHINALVHEGRGGVVCAPHLGPFHHVMGELMTRLPRMGVFAAPHLIAQFEKDWKYAARTRDCEIEILSSSGASSLRRALRLLKEGGFIVIYTDVDNRLGGRSAGDGNAVPLEFLGLPVRMRAGPAFLAQRTGAPLVPAASWTRRAFSIQVTYGAPIPVTGTGAEARESALRELYAWYEPHVRNHPDQWDGWFHHLLLWRHLGTGVSVTAEEFSREQARILALFEGGGARKARLRAESAHVGMLPLGEERMIIHGPRRRVLKGSPVACRLLELGFRGRTLARIGGETGLGHEVLARELARLTLAGLAEVGEPAAPVSRPQS